MYDESGAYDITGATEILGALDAALSDLEESGAARHPKLRGAHSQIRNARQEAKAMVQAIRRGNQPEVKEKGQGPLMELPFPLGTVTLLKSTSGSISNNAQGTFRVERLVVDEASATPAPWLLTVDDIKLGNIAQPLSGGSMLATFFGPQVFNTPFRGGTINSGQSASVTLTNLDGTNSRVAYATLFGNAIR